MASKVNWVDEQTAADLAGMSKEDLRRKVYRGELKIMWSKLSRKAKIKYNRNDIEQELMINAKTA